MIQNLTIELQVITTLEFISLTLKRYSIGTLGGNHENVAMKEPWNF